MLIAEIIAAILFFISLLMKQFHIGAGAIIFVFSGLVLLFIYTYLGFALFNGIGLRKIFKASTYKGLPVAHIVIAAVSGVVLGVGLVGLLFIIQHWPGLEFYRKGNFAMAILMTIASLVGMVVTKAPISKRIFFRALGLLVVYLLVNYTHLF